MKLRDAIVVGIAHLAHNKLQSGLSILGICIGITSVFCMIAIGDGAKLLITQDIEKLGGANQVQFWTRTSISNARLLHLAFSIITHANFHLSINIAPCLKIKN